MTQRTLIRRLSAAALLVCTGTAMAQPANDTCSTATNITTVPFADNVTNAALATSGLPDPSCNSTSATNARFDVWYTYTPSAAGIATLGHTDSNDTVTTIWTNSAGDCSGTWTQVSCTDSDTSFTVATLTPGTKYWIQLSMWSATATPSAAGYLWTFNYSVSPANDACANAVALTAGTPVTGDSTAATADGPTNTSTTNGCTATFFGASNRSVWYTFTPSTTGNYTVSTCTNAGFDNKIAIYAGSACTGSVASLACNDDSCGTRSSVAANLTAGQLYTIRLSGTGTGTTGGAYTIVVNGPAGGSAPSNDDGATPTTLTGNTPVNGDLTGATGLSTTLATCGSSTTTGNDVWYTFTPVVAGTHTVNVCANFDSVVSTHTSPTAASTVCNDDTIPAGCTLHGSSLTFTGVAGTPQLIRVAAVGPGTLIPETGTFTITVVPPVIGACCFAGSCSVVAQTACTGESTFLGANTTCSPNNCPAPVAGDLCSNPIIASVGSNVANNAGATTEPGTTLPSGCALSRNGNKDIFFSFTPANPGNYTFTLCNATSGTLDTVLSIHTTGCPTTSATLIAATPNCNDDGCSGTAGPSALAAVALTGGTTYLVRVANWSTTATVGGPFDLQITTDPFGTCCNSATAACRLSSQPTCNGANEVFQGQATCSPNPCPLPPVACCAPDGSCSFVAAASCVSPNVAQATGSSCTPNICPIPPANDSCSTPSIASVGNNTGTAVGASNDGRSSCDLSAGVDVWWSFNPPTTGNYRIQTCATAVDWDTVVSVHTACAPDTSTQISGACADQGCGTGNLSLLNSVSLTAGTNYLIRVGGWSTSVTGAAYTLTITPLIQGACCSGATCTVVDTGTCTGTYQGDNTTCTPNPCGGACCNPTTGACSLTVDAAGCTTSGGNFQGLGTSCTPNNCPPPPPPSNDLCSNPVVLSLGVAYSDQNATATVALDGPVATCQSTSGKSVWFTFTPSATSSYEVTTCGTNQDTVLQVYTITDCNDTNSWTAVACDDDSCDGVTPPGSGLASVINPVTFTAGTTYYIRLSSYSSTLNPAGGAYTIQVNLIGTIGSCCVGTACSLTDSANCTGTFTSGGACSPNPCLPPTGRCCVGARCAIVLPGACAGSGTAGAVFTGGAADCNASGVFNTPCCFADYNKAGGVTVQDIFDFLADWFSGSVNANVGGDGVVAPSVQDIFDFLAAWFAGGCV